MEGLGDSKKTVKDHEQLMQTGLERRSLDVVADKFCGARSVLKIGSQGARAG